MTDGKLSVSIFLSFISIIFSAVMLAGHSDDCGVVKNVAWGSGEFTGYEGMSVYLGTKQLCRDDSSDELFDDDTPADGINFSDLDVSDCENAGKVAVGFTTMLFIFSVLVFAISLLRKSNPASSPLRLAGVMGSVLALLFDIIAIGHFDDVCLRNERVDATFSPGPSVGITMGAILAFIIFANVGLQAAVSTTGGGEMSKGLNSARY